jgi:hypothetical protein
MGAIKTTSAFVASIIAFSANAAFQTNNWNDQMSDTKVYVKYTSVKSGGYNNYQHFGFECRITDGSRTGRVQLQFDGDSAIATPNSNVKIDLRVDKGQVFSLEGSTYSNSYRAGHIRDIPDELYTELKTGSKLHMNIYHGRELEVSETFSLAGSTAALNYVTNKCGIVVGESDELITKIKEVNDFNDKEIAKLNAERKSKLAAIK